MTLSSAKTLSSWRSRRMFCAASSVSYRSSRVARETLRPPMPPAALTRSRHALAPMTMSRPNSPNGPVMATLWPRMISWSFTPGSLARAAGTSAANGRPAICRRALRRALRTRVWWVGVCCVMATPRSAARKHRRAPFSERAHTFGEALTVHQLHLARALQVQLLGKGITLGGREDRARLCNGMGRHRGQLARQAPGLGVELRVFDAGPDQAPFLRSLRRQLLPGQRESEGSDMPDRPGQCPSRAHVGHGAERRKERQVEIRRLGGDH